MNRYMLIGLSCLLAVAAVPATATAQIQARGVVTVGSTTFAADQSFDAVLDTHRQTVWSVGGEVTLWKGVFAGVQFSLNPELEGERVFVHGGEVFKLGIPVRVRVRPVDIVGGWRFQSGRFSPFAGAGLAVVSYDESSDFAEAGDDVSERANGYVILCVARPVTDCTLEIGVESHDKLDLNPFLDPLEPHELPADIAASPKI